MLVYKYYEPESVDYILTPDGVSMRYSQPIILNDPFELRPTLNTAIVSYKKNLKSEMGSNMLSEYEVDSYVRDYKEKISLFYSNNLNETKGFISLSMNKKSRPMWAYYSKDHSGYLIEFKSVKSEKIKDKEAYLLNDIMFLAVDYNDQRSDSPHENPLNYYLNKDSEWRHENELRAISEIDSDNCLKTDSNGYPIFTEILDANNIASIILGVRASPILERKIKWWRNKYAKNVTIKKARLCESKFELIYDRI